MFANKTFSTDSHEYLISDFIERNIPCLLVLVCKTYRFAVDKGMSLTPTPS
jgi:hypothetical protein